MTAIPDLPLPGDWSPRRLLRWSAAAHLLLLLLALRHVFFWGGSVGWLLNLLEGAGLVAFTLLAGIAYGRVVRQASSLDLGFLLRGGVLLAALAALAPPFLSSDAWDYVARGQVMRLGHNPYTTSVESLKDLPAMAPFAVHAHAQWTTWVMPYGPITALLQQLVAAAGAPWPAVYAWKALAALAHLLTSWLVLLTLRAVGSERDARRGFAIWLWNPWILLECCGSAHNEAFVALGLAAMAWAVARSRFLPAALGFGGALLVKHGCAPVAAPLLYVALWQRRWRAFAAGTAFVLAAVAASYWLWWSAPGGLDWILRQGGIDRGSLQSLARATAGDLAGGAVLVLGLFGTVAPLVLAARRARDAQSFARWAALVMAAFVLGCVPNFAPWYHLWWLPLFALASLPVLARALELLAWTGPLYYLVFASTHEFGRLHEVWGLLVAGIWPALLVLLEWRALTGIVLRTVADGADEGDEAHHH